MRFSRRLSKRELREALRERLRYLAFKARRDSKSLTLAEIDELCEIIVVLGQPQKN